MDEKEHLSQFNGRCSILMRESAYEDFYRGRELIGRAPDQNDPCGSIYVSTAGDIDKALKECNGDILKLEASLGLPEGALGNGSIVRVDISNPEEHGLRVANGKETGANEFYNTPLDANGNLPNIQYTTTADGRWAVDTNQTDPGELAKLNGQYWDQNGQYHAPNPKGYNGQTSGGLDEAVINRVPNTTENVTYTKIEGFKRGEGSTLSASQINDGYAANAAQNKTTSQTVAENGGGARAPNGITPDQAPNKLFDPGIEKPVTNQAGKNSAEEAAKAAQGTANNAQGAMKGPTGISV